MYFIFQLKTYLPGLTRTSDDNMKLKNYESLMELLRDAILQDNVEIRNKIKTLGEITLTNLGSVLENMEKFSQSQNNKNTEEFDKINARLDILEKKIDNNFQKINDLISTWQKDKESSDFEILGNSLLQHYTVHKYLHSGRAPRGGKRGKCPPQNFLIAIYKI